MENSKLKKMKKKAIEVKLEKTETAFKIYFRICR